MGVHRSGGPKVPSSNLGSPTDKIAGETTFPAVCGLGLTRPDGSIAVIEMSASSTGTELELVVDGGLDQLRRSQGSCQRGYRMDS